MFKSGQHGGNTRQIAEQYGKNEKDIIDFSANINPLGIPANVKQVIIENLNSAEHYPDIDYRKLYQSISLHSHQPQENIIVGNGATELIYEWVQAIKPQKALLIEPSFGEYRRALAQTSCDIATHILKEENNFKVEPTLLESLSDNLDCLFLCTPNNPTGQLIEKELMMEIIDTCKEKNIHLMIDESFMEFVSNPVSMEHLLTSHPHLTILRSLTKFFAIPGLRLGYLMSGNTQLIQSMRTMQRPWTINTFAALAGEHLFSDVSYQEQTKNWLKKEHTFLFENLNKISKFKVWRSEANYLFFKLVDSDINLQEDLLKHNILIRSCTNYIGLNTQFYRVAIKSADNNQRLVTALEQILG